MRKLLRLLALAALTAGVAVPTEAAPIVSVNPATQTVNLGDTVSVDIIVSGIAEIGGISLLLGFDNAVITGTGFTANFGSCIVCGFGGGGSSPFQFVVENLGAGDAGAQNVNVVTVEFLATGGGTSPLQLGDVAIFGGNGTGDVDVVDDPPQTSDGSVTVVVPEPALLTLFAIGAVVTGRRVRKAAR